MTRRVLWIALFAALVATGASLVEYSETVKVEIVRVAGLGLLAMALARPRELHARLRSPLDVAFLAWLGVEILATLCSRAPALSFFGEQEQHEGLLTSLALAGVYAAARLEARDLVAARRSFDVLFAGAAAASGWAFLQALGLVAMAAEGAQLGGVLRPFGLLGHPNLLGVVTAAATAAAVARALTEERRRGLHFAAAMVFGAATAITFSRGAWLALVAGLACAAGLGARGRAGRPLPRRTWVAICAAAVAGVAIAAFAGWGGLFVSRLHDLLSPAGGSGGSRIEIWRAALAAWRACPLLGFGPDTFGLASAQFQTPGYWRVAWGEVTFHAHSIVLQTLATRGTLGALAGLGLALTLVRSLRRARAGSLEAAGLGVAIASAFAALAVAGAFGAWGVCGALLATLLAAHAAFLAEVPETQARVKPGRRARTGAAAPRRMPAAAAVAGIAVALATAAFAADELAGSRGIAESLIGLREAMNLPGDQAQAERAAVVDIAARAAKRLPWDDHAPRLEATALMQRAERWPDPGPLLAGAEAAARSAIARVPARAANHECLADVLVQRARGGEAVEPAAWDSSYCVAARLWPNSPFVLAGWARARIAGGARALDPARRLAAIYPASGLAQLVLAEAALAAGDTLGARAAIDRSSTADWHGDAGSQARAERLSRSLAAAGR